MLTMLEATPHIIAAGHVTEGDVPTPTVEAIAVNGSVQQQPIYNAKLYWYRGLQSDGNPSPEPIGAVPGYERTACRRAFAIGTDLSNCGALLTFHDAGGYVWMRIPDGALTEHQPRDLDDAAAAAIRNRTTGE